VVWFKLELLHLPSFPGNTAAQSTIAHITYGHFCWEGFRALWLLGARAATLERPPTRGTRGCVIFLLFPLVHLSPSASTPHLAGVWFVPGELVLLQNLLFARMSPISTGRVQLGPSFEVYSKSSRRDKE